jgi:hypothetical protein
MCRCLGYDPAAMAPARKGDLSAKMAILGLLVQRSDTIYGVKSRLIEKFPGASWSRTIAHNSVSSLAKDGHVRVAVGGAEPGLDLYEATSEGMGWFRQWLVEFEQGPPVLRDALRAKLEYVADEATLLAVIEAIREQEDACFDESEAAKARLRRAIRRGELGSARDAGWESRLRYALMSDEALLWRDMAVRRKRFRESLEDPEERFESPGEGYADGG